MTHAKYSIYYATSMLSFAAIGFCSSRFSWWLLLLAIPILIGRLHIEYLYKKWKIQQQNELDKAIMEFKNNNKF